MTSTTATVSDTITAPCGLPCDNPRSAADHVNDFCSNGATCLLTDPKTSVPARRIQFTDDDLYRANELVPGQYNLALRTGTASGIIAIQIGANRGDFVPNLKPGLYGVSHTTIGNLFIKTKRVISGSGNISVLFGIKPDDWLDGLNSCMLEHPDLESRGAINLLADGSYQLIEPSIDPMNGKPYRFYTPFLHIEGAGSGWSPDRKGARCHAVTHRLYHLGIMTLNRTQLSELLRGFNEDWINGKIFANRNAIAWPSPLDDSNRGGLDKWS